MLTPENFFEGQTYVKGQDGGGLRPPPVGGAL